VNAAALEVCQQYKLLTDRVVELAGGADKLVHLNVGLILWVAAALILRRPLRSFIPLLFVILIQIGNEIIDYAVRQSWTLEDMLLDTLATIGWPMLLWAALSTGLLRRS
jgi:hypothetical protein